jgi:hypothetical protein
MAQDLATLAPSAIVCVAFLVGAWLLVRRELAPKRGDRSHAVEDPDEESAPEPAQETAQQPARESAREGK